MKRSVLVITLASGIVGAACSGGSGNAFDLDSGQGVGADGGPITTPTGSGTGGGLPGGPLGSGTGSGGTPGGGPDGGPCPYTSGTVDHDGDGWSPADGDCNDCNKYINPGAYDVPGNGIDEDCDGHADNEPTGCDSSLSGVATTSGADGAKAMDLCRTTTTSPPLATKTWGVIQADYVTPDGNSTASSAPASYVDMYQCSFASSNFPLGFGILGPKFGTSNSVQQGQHMLGLSSGTARQPTDPGYQDVSGFDKCMTSGAPTGFPGQTPACGNITFGQPHDGAALRLVIRVPTNALTMSFDSNFFSFEFPDYVCSEYNDTYVVIMTPSPTGEPASANDNIAFDSKGNIISVNAGFLTVCDMPGAMGSAASCSEGAGKLLGTGFGVDTAMDMQNHASTDWLTTTVSVANLAGKDITLLFAIWDSSDGVLDSTVLVDNVHWTFATSPNTQPPPPMTPITQPK